MDPQRNAFLNISKSYNISQKTDMLVGLERFIIQFKIGLAILDTKPYAQTLSYLESERYILQEIWN